MIRRNDAVRARLRSALADDTVILATAAAGIAILNIALAVMVSHVRANDYDIRYPDADEPVRSDQRAC